MRIIAGAARGRKLQVAAGQLTRPTPARVREALFSMLARHVALLGATVLDVFAGSGALGIEALSRGARSATFVEAAAPALKALRHNLRPFAGRCRVLPTYAQDALAQLAGTSYDLIFCDPPYARALLPETLRQLVAHRLLGPATVVVCEHAGDQPLDDLPPALHHLQRRTFGAVGVALLTTSGDLR